MSKLDILNEGREQGFLTAYKAAKQAAEGERHVTCSKGIKCPCFCCLETDCEHYQSEAPEWVNDPDALAKEEAFGDALIKIAEEGKT